MRRPPLWTAITDAREALARHHAAFSRNDAQACLQATADLSDAVNRLQRALQAASPGDRAIARAALQPLAVDITGAMTRIRVRLAWMQDWQRRVTPPAVW